jgi:hypothetical protein
LQVVLILQCFLHFMVLLPSLWVWEADSSLLFKHPLSLWVRHHQMVAYIVVLSLNSYWIILLTYDGYPNRYTGDLVEHTILLFNKLRTQGMTYTKMFYTEYTYPSWG